MKELSWKPIKRGPVYCSPACGGDCTYDAFQKATSEANKLCNTLGPEWKPVVWENIGWHYRVALTSFAVYPPRYGGKTYSACFDNQYWQDGKGPIEAMQKVIDAMKKHAHSIISALSVLDK